MKKEPTFELLTNMIDIVQGEAVELTGKRLILGRPVNEIGNSEAGVSFTEILDIIPSIYMIIEGKITRVDLRGKETYAFFG